MPSKKTDRAFKPNKGISPIAPTINAMSKIKAGTIGTPAIMASRDSPS